MPRSKAVKNPVVQAIGQRRRVGGVPFSPLRFDTNPNALVGIVDSRNRFLCSLQVAVWSAVGPQAVPASPEQMARFSDILYDYWLEGDVHLVCAGRQEEFAGSLLSPKRLLYRVPQSLKVEGLTEETPVVVTDTPSPPVYNVDGSPAAAGNAATAHSPAATGSTIAQSQDEIPKSDLMGIAALLNAEQTCTKPSVGTEETDGEQRAKKHSMGDPDATEDRADKTSAPSPSSHLAASVLPSTSSTPPSPSKRRRIDDLGHHTDAVNAQAYRTSADCRCRRCQLSGVKCVVGTLHHDKVNAISCFGCTSQKAECSFEHFNPAFPKHVGTSMREPFAADKSYIGLKRKAIREAYESLASRMAAAKYGETWKDLAMQSYDIVASQADSLVGQCWFETTGDLYIDLEDIQ